MSQKYNFKGIKKVGAASVIAALTAVLKPMGLSWLVTNKLSRFVLNAHLQPFLNALANKGLLLINIGVINFDTEKDKDAYIQAMDEALRIVKETPNLTPEKIKEIDDAVIAKYDELAVFGKLRKP